LWIAQRMGVDPKAALERYYRTQPAWLAACDLTTPVGVAQFLSDLRATQSISVLANSLRTTRFSIARWLAAKTEPRLPEFFQFVEVASLRLLDFVALFVDPEQLPSVRSTWQALQRARSLAYERPWTQAILRCLELRTYREQPHSASWLAAHLGVDAEEVETGLQQLSSSRQVEWDGTHFAPVTVRAMDIGRDRAKAQQLRAWWGRVGVERAAQGSAGMVYNLFGVSHVDLQRLRLLQKQYIAELRNIVINSEPVQCVVLSADLLIDLSEAPSE
jgi:hypothetical protein